MIATIHTRETFLNFRGISKLALSKNEVRNYIGELKVRLSLKDHTSAFFISGSKRRFTKMYHKDSPALGRTYKASSPRLAFFSNNTERADSPPASQ